jgi:Carboxylesterase family
LDSQAQYIAAERSEVWVNIGYRLSVFGFLACDKPRIEGNFGFKDQWMALEWIRDNIGVFGGMMRGLSDPRNLILFILQYDRRPAKCHSYRFISRRVLFSFCEHMEAI